LSEDVARGRRLVGANCDARQLSTGTWASMSDQAPLYVAVGEVDLHFPGARSLKDKRQDLRSLLDRLRHRFAVLVVESDYQNLHQRAGVALCAFATEHDASSGTVARALDHIHDSFPGVVLDEHVSVLQVR
jgi:uncharacterized protein